MTATHVLRLMLIATVVALAAASCGSDDAQIGVSPVFDGCDNGARSVISFLQRSLDDVGDADRAELAAYEDRFAFGVHALLLRAQEMHCTEGGFNDAVIARVDELKPNGPIGEALITKVSEIGLGSLDASRGGPLTLPEE